MRIALSLLVVIFSLEAQSNQSKPEPEDSGPPVLKRGAGNTQHKTPQTKLPPLVKTPPPDPDAPPPPREAAAAIAGRQGDDLIERAREAANSYDEGLPNFICDQLTMRSSSSTRVPNWKMRDRVESELIYVDRREEYRNIRLNGKARKREEVEKAGQWSTGDFGSVLVDVLSPATNAKFTKRGHDVVEAMGAIVYDYTVEKANSHWEVRYGTPIRPAYKGAIWIDPQSARVLRVEMQARDLQSDYAMDVVEMNTQYGWITIAGKKYLLPTDSENLSCQRGTFDCSRNQLQYRNYRKYGAESSISTTDSAVSFEGANPPPPDPKPATAPSKKKK